MKTYRKYSSKITEKLDDIDELTDDEINDDVFIEKENSLDEKSIDSDDSDLPEKLLHTYGFMFNNRQDEMYDARWKSHLIYPCPDQFRHSYLLLLKHQSIYWNSFETDLREDEYSLANCPPTLKKLLFRANAMLASGDKVVIDIFSLSTFQDITSLQIKAFFADQTAREAIHQISYSKILELCKDNKYLSFLRSEEFINTLCAPLLQFNKDIIEDQKLEQYPSIMMLLLMCTERLMFCVPFAINMYAGVMGYAGKIADITRMVMCDENLHYHHARGLKLHRLDMQVVCEFFSLYRIAMRELIYRLFMYDWNESVGEPTLNRRLEDENSTFLEDGEDVLPDPLYTDSNSRKINIMNYASALSYFDYEYYCMLYENGIIPELPKHVKSMQTDDSKFPFAFMRLNEQESTTNLMEAVSTIYAVPNTNDIN